MFTIPIFRVLIADGHAPTLASLRRVFEEDDRFRVCAEIDNAAGAVAGAVRARPDVCVLDIKLPGGGLSAAWEISARLPRVKLVMLTGSDDESDLFAALRAGADGYLLKTPRFDHLPDLVAGVCVGEAAVDPAFVGSLLRQFRTREPRWRRPVSAPPDGSHSPGLDPGPADSRLTSREWEVLDLLSAGQSTAGISRTLMISASAVRVHIAAVVRKLGVADRAQAVEVLRGPELDRSDN
jgi:DNA-binding NarL/FixJ family response regulator